MSSRKATPRASFSAGSKSIEMLPSTTLKDREGTSEPPETAVKHSSSFSNSGKLSPSPSQAECPISQPAYKLANQLAISPQSVSSALANLHTSRLFSCLNVDRSGISRTPSGMLMPYEEDEDDVVTDGLFGKVVDTVNTAKDIVYVI
ncbi:hypothetical protein DL95DRAFT_479523, partial [Leptodontidium sp. 2 PMI_412]